MEIAGQEEGMETWPEIEAIMSRIRTLEGRLRSERKTTAELSLKIKQLESSSVEAEEERQRAAE